MAIFSVEDVTALRGSDLAAFERCLFLCDDVVRQRETERVFGRPVDTCGARFHSVYQDLEPEMLSVFAGLAKANESRGYWSTSLASRSSSTEPVVKHLIYFFCALDYMRALSPEAQKRVAIVVDSPALGATLARELRLPGPSNAQVLKRKLLLRAKVVARTAVFVARTLKASWRARGRRLKRLEPGEKPMALMRSWVTRGFVKAKPGGGYEFRDRNFGELGAFLEKSGYQVAVLPLFFNLEVSEEETYARMQAAGVPVVVPELFLNLGDIIQASVGALVAMRFNFEPCVVRGIDMRAVFEESHLRTHASPELLRFNLSEPLCRRLAADGFPIAGFYYPFENNPVEKPFLVAAKKYFPQAKRIGFQHTVWLREQLAMRVDRKQEPSHPLPDRILLSGRIYEDVISRCGFAAESLKLGANLRYAEVNAVRPSAPATGAKSLLVILNYNMAHSLELLLRVRAAYRRLLKEVPQLEMRVKLHPLLSRERIETVLREDGSEPYVFVDGTVQEWVEKSTVVLMVAASVSNLEVLVAGRPLLRLSLASDFNFDCIWKPHSLSGLLSSEDEVVAELRKWLSGTSESQGMLKAIAEESRTLYFEPVTEAGLRAFLPT